MGHVYNLKNSLMFKLLAFWRNYTPFIDQKALMKRQQKICAGPPPSFGQNPKERQLFSGCHPLLIIVISLHNCNSEAKKFYT